MKGKFIINIILIVLLGIIQTTFPKTFEIGYAGIKPNLLLIFIILYAFFNGSYRGGIVGFTTGLIQDLSTGTMIGFYALIGLCLGLLVGWSNSRIYKENIIIATLIVLVGTIIYEFIVAILLGMKLFSGDNLIYAFKFIIFPEALYNGILSVIIYFVMNYFNKRFRNITERGSARNMYR